jgi:hypothetical protein
MGGASLVGGEHKASFFRFMRDVHPDCGEVRAHSCHHGRAVEIKTADIVAEFLFDRRSEAREILGGRPSVNNALMPWCFHSKLQAKLIRGQHSASEKNGKTRSERKKKNF